MINKVKYFILELYIFVVVVFLDRSYLSISSFVFIIFVMFFFLLNLQNNNGRKMTKSFLKIIVMLTFSVGIILIKSQYSVINTILVYGFIIIAYIEFATDTIEIPEMKWQKWFDFFVAIGLISYWIFGATKDIADVTSFILPSAWDKNYTGITIFLLLVYFYKRKYKLGLIACFPYIITLNSRLLQLCVVMVVVLEIGIRFFVKYNLIKEKNKIFSLKAIHIFVALVLITVFMTVFSMFWITRVSNQTVDEYQASWNDKSNAIRTRSNIYAAKLIFSNKELVLYGFDDDIKNVLGVEDENSATVYSGYRLVQPHNLILNLILRHGLLFTIMYIYLLSKIISVYWNKDNISFIITYLFANMLMHSLLSTTYMIFFLFVLCNAKKNKPLFLKVRLRV